MVTVSDKYTLSCSNEVASGWISLASSSANSSATSSWFLRRCDLSLRALSDPLSWLLFTQGTAPGRKVRFFANPERKTRTQLDIFSGSHMELTHFEFQGSLDVLILEMFDANAGILQFQGLLRVAAEC